MFILTQLLKINYGDFPGGPVVKNLPYNAGDTGSLPDQGTKIPHAAGQLSHNYWARAPKLESPHAANYRAHVLWSLRTTTGERKPARHD